MIHRTHEKKSPDNELEKFKSRLLSIAKQEGLKIRGVIINNNVDNLASVDSRKNLRIQEIFLKADSQILRALIRTCARRTKTSDTQKINDFIVRNPPGKKIKTAPKNLLKDCYGPHGDYYNLDTILDKIMAKYTGTIPDIQITWRKASRGKKYITWGTYREVGKGGLIKINKILDDPRVPGYVIESIVYHELLHYLAPVEAREGEFNTHTGKFKRLLSRFPHLEKAEEWKKNFFFDFPLRKKQRK